MRYLATMKSIACVCLGLGLVVLGCTDDSDGTGAGGTTSSSTSDSGGSAGSGGMTTTTSNGGGGFGGGVGGAGGSGGGMLQCFSFSNDPNVPLAIDGTFDASSEQWRRPHDEPAVCPATALLPDTAALVPFVAYAFCNDDTVAHTYDFEMLAQDGSSGESPLDDPYLFLYEGNGIPSDPLQCLAVNDDIPNALDAKDSEILGVVVPPGGAITMVGTTFTFDASDGTGTGYYILVASNAD